MKANNKQVGMFILKEMKYRLYLLPLNDPAFRVNSALLGQQRCFFMQLTLGPAPIFSLIALGALGSTTTANEV